MKSNWYIAGVVSVGAVVALTICVIAQHRIRLRLVEDHNALQQQLNQMAELVVRNEQLSNRLAQANAPHSLPDEQSRELLRLRGQVGVLRQQARELETVRAENREARAALESALKPQGAAAPKPAATADYWPQDSWTFRGFGSPDAALQSSLAAANSGDLKRLAASATGNMQKMLEADFAGKSDTEASIRAMDEVMNIKSVRILNRETQAADTVVITAEFEDRTETHTAKLVMKKVGNDWKFAGLPELPNP